jgi:hypothetical protein
MATSAEKNRSSGPRTSSAACLRSADDLPRKSTNVFEAEVRATRSLAHVLSILTSPFDPEDVWQLKPVRLDPRREGWLFHHHRGRAGVLKDVADEIRRGGA